MKFWRWAGLGLLGLATPLAAQEVRVGVALDVPFPTGAFYSTNYPPQGPGTPATSEDYNPGLGVQLDVSTVPEGSQIGIRFSLSRESFGGQASALGPGAELLNGDLHQVSYDLGVAAQIFTKANHAKECKGGYGLAGLSLDRDSFTQSGSALNNQTADTLTETRLALVLGWGHLFDLGGHMRCMMELAYHKTLSMTNTGAGDPPASNYVRFSTGLVF